MKSESDNSKLLRDFFDREYQSLRIYVNSRIRETANREAEDIIQDVALKLFSGAERYAPINNVAGFVYRSIKNKIVDIMRSKKQEVPVDPDDQMTDLAEMMQQSLEDGSSEKEIAILKESIKELKPAYRDIIIAVDFEGYSYKEISEETGIPQGTLMSRRHRAIGILYKKIESEIKNIKN